MKDPRSISSLRIATHRALGCLLALLACVASVAADDGWKEFEGEGFHILMPGKPESKSSTTPTPVGSVVNHEHVVWLNDQTWKFEVDVSDLPHAAVMFLGPDAVYSNAKGGLLKRALGKAVSFADVRRDHHSGKELVYRTAPHGDLPGEVGKAQMFLIERRLLVFEARAPISDKGASVERFFASISLSDEAASSKARDSSHSW